MPVDFFLYTHTSLVENVFNIESALFDSAEQYDYVTSSQQESCLLTVVILIT